MAIQDQIDRINGEVAIQSNLISQIRTALDGATVGGGDASAQADWNQTDETAADFIKNKPFVLGHKMEGMFPTKFVTTTDIHPTFNMCFAQYEDSSYTLEVGETYIVVWDGISYECTGIDVSAVFGIPGSVAIGNGAAAGYPSNNEPFIIGKFEGDLKAYIAVTDTEVNGKHTVQIYKPSDLSSYKIKVEHLPTLIYNPLTTELRPTKTLEGFTLDTTFGMYQINEEDDSYTLEVGKTYNVIWDNVQYTCVGQDVSAVFDVSGAVAIGNGSAVGYPSNNEPFIIAKVNGDWKVYAALTDTEAGGSHTVRIYQVNNNGGYRLNGTYLPEFTRTTLFAEQPVETHRALGVSVSPLYNVQFTLTEGDIYIVLFDGTEYELKAYKKENAIWLGDYYSTPFVVAYDNTDGNGNAQLIWSIILEDEGTVHTAGIYKRSNLGYGDNAAIIEQLTAEIAELRASVAELQSLILS